MTQSAVPVVFPKLCFPTWFKHLYSCDMLEHVCYGIVDGHTLSIFYYGIITLVNVYVGLVVFTRIAGTS